MEHIEISSVWPEWTVVERIGAGSYGVVYKAVRKEHGLESSAAIKVISIPQNPSEVDSLHAEGLSLDDSRTYFQSVVEDFINEIRVMESLKGMQNIVSVEDYKVVEHTDGIGSDIFIRMELLTPFPQYLQDRQLSQEEVVKLGCEICQALAICQQKDIIHRDIKPENIFVNDFGFFKLGDFGVARKLENLSGSLSQKGTYNYMAPEVASGTHYDARADIYSLGIVLYRLLNGNRYPFLDSDAQVKDPIARKTALERRLRGEPLPPPRNASPALARVILKACLPDPQRRYQTPEEFQAALSAAAKGEVDDLDATVSVHRAHAVADDTVSVRRNYDAPAPRYTAPPQQPYPQPPQYQPPTYDQVPTFGAPQKEKSSVNKGLVVALVILALVAVISVTVLVMLKTQEKDESPAQETSVTEPMDHDVIAEDEQDDLQSSDPDPEPQTVEPEPEPEPRETQEEILADVDNAVETYLYAYIQDINNGGYSQLNAAIKSGSDLEETQRKFIQNSSLYEDLLSYQIVDHKKVNDKTYHVTSIEEYDVYNYDSDAKYYIKQKCVYVVKRQDDGRWLICDYAENVEQLDKVVYGAE